MAEFVSGKTDGEAQDLVDHPVSEAGAPAQDQSRENTTASVAEISTRSSFHGMRWLALLLIVAVLPLAWFLSPENARQKWADTLMNHIAPQKTSHVAPVPHTQAQVPAPAAPSAALAIAVAPKKEASPRPLASEAAEPVVPAQVSTTVVAAPHSSPASPGEHAILPAVTPQEAKALMAAMEELQSNMHALEGEQEAMGHELHARQQLELRARLRWITSASTLLPQMADFWQDITLLPLLNASERSEATSMWKTAASDADKLRAWSTRLKRLAATLPAPQHQDIIPKPKQAVFSWLTGKFHLRPAPTPEQRSLSELRMRLLEAAHVLTVEIWPKHRAWRHLLADLRERFGDDADLSLPQRLDGVRKDIATMRAKAASWLLRLSIPVSRPEHPRTLSGAGN